MTAFAYYLLLVSSLIGKHIDASLRRYDPHQVQRVFLTVIWQISLQLQTPSNVCKLREKTLKSKI